MLGVFLLPAFTRLGHERQNLLCPCDGMHVCTDQISVYTLIRKSFGGNGVRAHVNSKGKIPSTGKKSLQRRIEPTTLLKAGQRAHHTTNELFRPSILLRSLLYLNWLPQVICLNDLCCLEVTIAILIGRGIFLYFSAITSPFLCLTGRRKTV